MASNNKLYRNFVILQEDERGYANSEDKTLSGYSKIEAKGDKCKISFYAQNLKKDDDKYYMVLICSKRDIKQIVNLGVLEITDKGKVEVTKEFNISNIAGLNLDFDKISGTAIIKINNDSPIFVMCGFLNGKQPTDNWKEYTIVKARDIRSARSNIVKGSNKDIRKNDSKNNVIKEKTSMEDKNKIEEKPILENDIRNEVEEKIESNDIEEVSEPEELEIIEEDKHKENLRGKFEDYEDEIEINKEFDPVSGKIRGSIGEYFESIVEGFERDIDSIDEIKYTKWYKIPVSDLREMCNMTNYNKYTLAYYPMLNYYPYIKKYGFFMIGYKCDSKGNLKHIIYGVPGKKNKDEQPYDGRTGFVTWVNIKNNLSEGCWLMFYDFKNSTVVVPMK